MGITDKITGRIKKAAGDLTDDASLRREGRQEERKGEAKEERERGHEKADRRQKRSLTSSEDLTRTRPTTLQGREPGRSAG